MTNDGGLSWQRQSCCGATARARSYASWRRQSEDTDQVRRLPALALVYLIMHFPQSRDAW